MNPEPNQPESERDWSEDFSHENGTYENRCVSCGELFFGHKRRVTCKLCATPMTPTDPPSTSASHEEIPTPRVDQTEYHPLADNYLYVVDADFARQLERELIRLSAEREELKSVIGLTNLSYEPNLAVAIKAVIELSKKQTATLAERDRQLAEASRERERFLQPLRAIVPHTYGDSVTEGWDLGDLENHEWDNKTTEEQAAWLIQYQRFQLAASDRQLAELREQNAGLQSQVDNNDVTLEQVRVAMKSNHQKELKEARNA